MTLRLVRYRPDLRPDWDAVLAAARNGVFLFERAFIEYHGDRFRDFSYLCYLDERPVALFPAALADEPDHVVSHPGLTFGGPVFRKDLRSSDAIAIVDSLLVELKAEGIARLTVKLLPAYFCTYPAEEAAYAFWRRGFTLGQRALSSVIPLADRLPFNRSKAAAVSKARQNGIALTEPGLGAFHALLEAVLRQRHEVEPVHSLAELALLKARFPTQIFTGGATLDGALIAGVLVFDYGRVWHTQYMAASAEARKLGALDLVIDALIREATARGTQGLSFGVSTTEGGRSLNAGLLWQKESYGARAIVHDHLTGRL